MSLGPSDGSENGTVFAAVAAAAKPRAPADLYRAIFDSTIDFAIVSTDLEGMVTAWNTGAERIFHWAAEEMIGHSIDSIFTPEDKAIHRSAVEMTYSLLHGRASDERWHLCRDGSRFWASGEMMVLKNDADEAVGFVKVLRDFTIQREAIEAQRTFQGMSTLIQNSVNDCTVVMDLEGHTLHVSPGGIASMEISDVESILGLSWLRVWKGDDHAAACAALATARAGGVGQFRGFCPTHKGTPKWWDLMVSPLPGPDGAPQRLVSVGRDITAWMNAEQRLARSEERLQLALGASGMVGIWDWDLKTDLLYADANFARMYGVDPEAAERGAPVSIFMSSMHPEDVVAFQKIFEQLLVQGDQFSLEYRVLQPAAEVRWLHAGGRLVRSADGVPQRFAGASVDVTERKHAEAAVLAANFELETRIAQALAEQAKMEETLRQSQKMEAVGQLTGGLAHDFNNLLASISGSLEMMQRKSEGGKTGDLQRYIGIAQGATQRAAALTHRLLAFSRRQTLESQPTDVDRLVGSMEDLIRRTVGPSVQVEVAGAPDLWTAQVDPNQLENALLNLCINARDAMPEGGRLTIETANQWIDERLARDNDLLPGAYVLLGVTDTGTGMSPEVIRRVFEPFFTTKPMGLGTGLGLSMVYGFARQSGGQVQVYSEVGQGTTMRVYLPRSAGEPTAERATLGPALAHRAAAGDTVLVVDDEPALRVLVAEVLQDMGYASIEASDGPTGLSVLQSGARVDLMVTDVGLPGGMNGRQLADAGRQLRPGLRVLFITGFAETAVIGNGMLEAGMQVLTKPFTMEDLSARVRQLIALPGAAALSTPSST